MATDFAKSRRKALTTLRTFETSSTVGDDSFTRARKMYELYIERKKINGRILDPQILLDGFYSSGLSNYINHPKYGLDAQRIKQIADNEVKMFAERNENQDASLAQLEEQLKEDVVLNDEDLRALKADSIDLVDELAGRFDNAVVTSSELITELKELGLPWDKIAKFQNDSRDALKNTMEYSQKIKDGIKPNTNDMWLYTLSNPDDSPRGVAILPPNSEIFKDELSTHRAINSTMEVATSKGEVWADMPVAVATSIETIDGEKVRVGRWGDEYWSSYEDGTNAPLSPDNEKSSGSGGKNIFDVKDADLKGGFDLNGKIDQMRKSNNYIEEYGIVKSTSLRNEEPSYYQMGYEGSQLRELDDEALEYAKQDPILSKKVAGARSMSSEQIKAFGGGDPDLITFDDMKGIGLGLGAQKAKYDLIKAETLAKGAEEFSVFGKEGILTKGMEWFLSQQSRFEEGAEHIPAVIAEDIYPAAKRAAGKVADVTGEAIKKAGSNLRETGRIFSPFSFARSAGKAVGRAGRAVGRAGRAVGSWFGGLDYEKSEGDKRRERERKEQL